jgi:hypothetical protein
MDRADLSGRVKFLKTERSFLKYPSLHNHHYRTFKCPTLGPLQLKLALEAVFILPDLFHTVEITRGWLSVVVLIDNYDTPVTRNVDNLELAIANAKFLHDFFATSNESIF